MNILHESLLITSAPAEVLVVLAIVFCVSGVILFALSIEAGNYPELVRCFALLRETHDVVRSDRGPDFNSHIWHAVTGGYEYERTP